MSHYVPVSDPFPGKGPIPAGDATFYEREEDVAFVVSHLRAGDSVSIVGERKAGKTSFLNHLLASLPSNEFIPVLVDVQGIAPKADKMFLGQLAASAAEVLATRVGLGNPIETHTFEVQPDQVYLTFKSDLDRLRGKLPLNTEGERLRLVWLIDEVETLRSYKNTELFTFLRPLAQSDPDFRLVVAGYDVLYALSGQSECAPFFNAFGHHSLEGLNPIAACQMINDATTVMQVTIESNLCESILDWTGQKPYFLKWILSKIAEALNQQQTDRYIGSGVLRIAQQMFLADKELSQHFSHLWDAYVTERQQTVLSLLAQVAPYSRPEILQDLMKAKLIAGDRQAAQHLIEVLTRLRQLGFLYERLGRYTFTSGCLQDWTRENKPR